ncbi:hypothetical protein [Phaeobacter inhibens]
MCFKRADRLTVQTAAHTFHPGFDDCTVGHQMRRPLERRRRQDIRDTE